MNDLISRQAAIKKIRSNREYLTDTDYIKGLNAGIEYSVNAVENLPSAQPKRGYWIESHEHIYVGNGVKEWTNWYCSECDAPNDKPTDFCPNCGVGMERETNT